MKKRIYKYLTECLREIIGIFEYLEGRWWNAQRKSIAYHQGRVQRI